MGQKPSVGITSIDQQHDALDAALQGLFTEHVPTREEFLEALDGLAKSVADHFAHEELIMRNIGLPEYPVHAAAHRKLLDELINFRAEVEGAFDHKSVEELRTYLTYWLFHHISKDDMRIRDHLYR